MNYLVQLENHGPALCSWSQNVSLCVWGCTAASTPRAGTAGMHAAFLLEGLSIPHIFFQYWNSRYRGKRGLTKGNWNEFRTFDSFFGIRGRTNHFIIKNSRALPVPGTYAVLSSCESKEPFVTEKTPVLPSSHQRTLTCSGQLLFLAKAGLTGNNVAYSRHSN